MIVTTLTHIPSIFVCVMRRKTTFNGQFCIFMDFHFVFCRNSVRLAPKLSSQRCADFSSAFYCSKIGRLMNFYIKNWQLRASKILCKKSTSKTWVIGWSHVQLVGFHFIHIGMRCVSVLTCVKSPQNWEQIESRK